MKQFEKKIILASSEFKETQLGSFFQKQGFEISSEFNPKEIESYSFAIDDYKTEIKNIPRLKTNSKKEFKEQDRAYIEAERLNTTTLNLLENYFSDKEELDLIDRYSKNHKDILTLKIQDYLNIGYFIDLIIVEAYKNSFDIATIRNYLNEGISTIFELSEEKGSTLPIEISFSNDGNVFAVSLLTSIKSFDLAVDILSKDHFQDKFISSNNFVDFTYLESREKLMVTALWIKDNPRFHGCFFTTVQKRSKNQKPDIEVKLAKTDSETKYKPDGQESKKDQTLLGLARKFAIHVKQTHKDDFEYFNAITVDLLKSDLKSYSIQTEVAEAGPEVFAKAIQILKNNSEDIKVTISGEKIEEDKSKMIISGSKEESEEKFVIAGASADESTSENLKVTDLSATAKVIELENELKVAKLKLSKSVEQSAKVKKLLDQLKAEYTKLKDSQKTEEHKEKLNENLEKELAGVVETSKLNDLKKELLSIKLSEKNLQKIKSDLENSNEAKEEKIKSLEQKIENFRAEFHKTKEFANQERVHELESENKLLQTKVEVISKNLTNATSNNNHKENDQLVKKEKENETLKSQIQMAHALINKFKSEKFEIENRYKTEIEVLKKKLSAKEPTTNDQHHHAAKSTDDKAFEDKISMLAVEKKQFEDKFKEQGLELKKLEHKMKILTSQLDEANRKKNKPASNANSNETYIKQVEFANKKLGEVSTDLTEKKKEIIKLKQDNNQLGVKVQELEKKLAAYEKKAA